MARPYRGRIKIAAQVQDFDPAAHLSASELPFCDPVSQYVLAAADEAVAQAGLASAKPMGPRTATIIGTGIGGMHTLENGLYLTLVEQGRPDPLTVPRLIPSACPSLLSIRYGANGPCFAVASACSSATQAIGIGVHLIRSGLVDRAIVGGTEDCVTNSSMLAWEALRVLTPDACRPFSKGRNGMVLGAGAAVFVLEEADFARARGAEALAEIAGYGTSTDAKDPVRPDAQGAAACMRNALSDAGVEADDIDYVNAHGTGTIVNDATESEALGARLRQAAVGASDFLDETDPRPCARRRRRARTCRDDRRRARECRAADHQLARGRRQMPRRCRAQRGASPADPHRPDQFLRFRRYQRQPHRPARRGGMTANQPQAGAALAPEPGGNAPVRLPAIRVRTERSEVAGFLRETGGADAAISSL